MTTHRVLSARISGRRFAGLIMAGAAILGLTPVSARAEGPLLTPKTGISREYLSTIDVGKIIGQVVQEAKARNRPATIAIVDRLGAVLAIYRMTGAPTTLPVESNPKGPNANLLVDGLSGAAVVPGTNIHIVPTEMEALAKAITGAYLSTSHGNAFSTRTASQIVQDHFNPGIHGQPSGPLFGVQFSSLPCSDFMVRSDPALPSSQSQGPHRSPLGLAGDPGGFPLYKNGELVGGIGVKAEGPYRVDENVMDNDHSTDEIEALAGTQGYSAPTAIRADHITAGGITLRYSDAQPGDLITHAASATPFSKLPASAGALLPMPGYYEPVPKTKLAIRSGSRYGSLKSGLVQDTTNKINATRHPYLLVDRTSHVRYPATAGAGAAAPLTSAETLQILRAAYASGIKTRAQIRNPPGSVLAVTISVVDANGKILGVVTIPDAPVFGIDVSLQKARSAVFMSSAHGDEALLSKQANSPLVPALAPFTPQIAKFSKAATAFFGKPVFSGNYAWSDRSVGNIERDTFPDGIDTTPAGPLSLAQNLSTPFSDGLQLNLILNNIALHILYVAGLSPADTPAQCTTLPAPPGSPSGMPILSNGLQIFPGGFPIYRNGQLVGGIGISGDGVDQDDMTGFLGIYNAGQQLKTGIGEAPSAIRSSQLHSPSGGLGPHYVNCPFAPYVDSNSQNLCIGK